MSASKKKTVIIFRLFILVISVCFSVFVRAEMPVVITPESSSTLIQDENIVVLHDIDKNITFGDVISEEHSFQSVSSQGGWDNLNSGQLWARFILHNPGNQHRDLLLATDKRTISDATFYSPNGNNGSYHSQSFGDSHRYDQRPVKVSFYTLTVHLPPHSTQQYYLRWHNEADMSLSLRVVDPVVYMEQQVILVAIAYTSFGIGLGLVIYNLLLFIYTREISYLYYFLFAASLTIYNIMADGPGYQFWPNIISNEFKISALGMLVLMGCFFLVLFSRSYLKTKLFMPSIDRTLFLWCFVLAGEFSVYHIVGASVMGNIMLISLLMTFLALFLVGIYSLQQRHRAARIYAIAFSIFLIGATINALRLLDIGMPENVFTIQIVRIGFFLNLLLLSIGVASNINRTKEEQLKAHADINAAQESERLKSQFLASMSHEIRTPMNGVLGVAELLKDTSMNKEQGQLVETIINSGKLLLRVLSDILDFSKIEAGKMQIENIDFDLKKLVDECTTLFTFQSRNDPLQFIVCMDPHTPIHIQGDPIRIRQILTNFLSNAFKFTEKGSVQLQVSNRINKSGDAILRFEVIDTGVGLTKKQEKKLFRAFVQADTSTTRHYGGTGLGLAICKRLTDLLNGKIGVNSTIGSGSTFWFEIPLVIASNSNPQAEIFSSNQMPDKHILIVNSNKAFLTIITEVISDWGMTYDIANDLEEALSLLVASVTTQPKYDMVMLDYELTEKNWLILAKKIQLNPHYKDLPLVLITAQHNELSSEQVAEAGINFILEEPITSNKLRDAIIGTPVEYQPKSYIRLNALSRLNVLVVEDNKVNQLVVTRMLEKYGINANVVENGLLAVEVYTESLKGNSIDVILMDCEMPIMDGFTATQKIRSLESEKKSREEKFVLIIGISAHAQPESRKRAKSAGMNNYITKPIDKSALLAALEQNSNWENNTSSDSTID